MKQISIFIFSLMICAHCFGQQYSKSWKDLDYGGDEKVYHKMDIYLPQTEKPTYPVVVVIYGSAWFSNNLKETVLSSLGKPLLDAGFAIVTPNHRSSTDAKFPAQINDIKAVVRFIRANAAKYQIDTSFIGITGFSSGGHLASLAGTSGGVKQYTIGSVTFDIESNVGQDTSFSSSVNAVVDWFGPIDISVMDSCKRSKDINSPEAILIGGPIEENLDKCALANPITYIDTNDPPFLILHGDADPLVPLCQSELFFNALQKANVPGQFVIVPGGQHGPGLFDEKYYKMMTDFFLREANITAVTHEVHNSPLNVSVSQNYPNPFNPVTAITFVLPAKLFVTLVIYDSLGREVSKLVYEELPAGTYTREWNAEGLSSGTYFARLQAGSYIETKKIILVK